MDTEIVMTPTEAYDLACTKIKEPVVVRMGDACLIGEWVLLSEYNEALCTLVVSKAKGVRVLGQGRTWEEAAAKAGLAFLARKEPITAVSRKSLPNICPTYGCGEVRSTDQAFCPKCFEEHRSERDMKPGTIR